jgi:predicted GTPase
MGYGPEQIRELEQTINAVDCDLVLIATPVDLRRLISLKHPTCLVRYEFEEAGGKLRGILADLLAKDGRSPARPCGSREDRP